MKRRAKLRTCGPWVLAVSTGMAVVVAACTPATNPPLDTGAAGRTGQTSGTGGSVGSGGSPGSGGGSNTATGGMTGATDGGNVTSTGGNPGAGGSASGSGGSAPTGGSRGSGGTTGAGGGSNGSGGSVVGGTGGSGGAAASGCNWVHDTTNDTWSFNPPAQDKVVLFDGTSLSGWHKLNMPGVPVSWMLIPSDMSMQVVPSGTGQATQIQSNMKFDDVCVHVEYLTPAFPSTTTDVQKQGNSGVYLKSAYEMQILDTHNSPPLIDGCGAVYKVSPPLVVACNQYLVWNTYEIEFKSSVWDNSSPPKKIKDAVFVQVALNGKIVQRNVSLNPAGGCTQAGIPDEAGPQPLGLQDHLDLVRFRNIWVTIPHS